MIDEQILVSVCCTAYNHEKYIRKCLDGFIMQETDFKYEVIINDDASTDNTADIIREYEEKYPDIIKPIYQTENQYSQGINISVNYLYPMAKGKYIALCEGDDFWIDPYKLQKQVKAMEENSECHMCVHEVQCVNEAGDVIDEVIPHVKVEDTVLSSADLADLLLVEACPFQTSSYLMRATDVWHYCHPVPYFRQISPVGDLCYLLYFMQIGEVAFLKQKMSCYRRNSIGSWSKGMEDTNNRVTHFQKMLLMIQEYNKYTNRQYERLCASLAWNYQKNIAFLTKSQDECKKLLEKKELFNNQDIKTKLLILMGGYTPKTLKKYHKVKGKLINVRTKQRTTE